MVTIAYIIDSIDKNQINRGQLFAIHLSSGYAQPTRAGDFTLREESVVKDICFTLGALDGVNLHRFYAGVVAANDLAALEGFVQVKQAGATAGDPGPQAVYPAFESHRPEEADSLTRRIFTRIGFHTLFGGCPGLRHGNGEDAEALF